VTDKPKPKQKRTRFLTPLEEKYARARCEGLGPSDAYRKAGYSIHANPASMRQAAYTVEHRKHIQARIETLESVVLRKIDIAAPRIVAELAALAFSDVAELFDGNGELLSPDRLPEHVSRAVRKVTRRVKHRTWQRDGQDIVEVDTETSYEMHAKQAALDKLAEMQGITERSSGASVQVTINLEGKGTDP
jgi:phage terminase small subunit